MKLLTTLVLLNGVLTLVGQNILSIHPGAKGAGLGSIKSVHSDVLAMYGNEAGLGFMEEFSIYASAERRFNREGLNFYSLASAYPTTFGTFGLLMEYYGFELFNETLIGLGYGRKLSQHWSIGAQFDYLQFSILNYGTRTAVTAEIGVLAKLGSRAQLGFHVYNPFDIKLIEHESLPAVFALGILYQPTQKVRMLAEVEKVTAQSENIKGGIEYYLLDRFAVRLGINSNPSLITFGVGYQLQNGFSMDVGSTVHQTLGISPLAGIGYQRSKMQ